VTTPKNLVPIMAGENGADIPSNDQAWLPAALGNSWVNYPTLLPVQYRKTNGLVIFEGAIESGSAIGVTTLPAGYRPASTLYSVVEIVISGVFGTGLLTISSAGVVNVLTQAGAVPSAAFWSLVYYGDV
jgi:hypothetical protein